MHTLENLLQALDPHSAYLQWNKGQVDDGKRSLPFFYRNVLDCVRYLLRQIAYRDDLSTRRAGNTTPMDNRYTQKCTRQTGGGIFNYSLITLF